MDDPMHLAEDLAGLVCRLRGWDVDAYLAHEAAMARARDRRVVDYIVIDLRFAIIDVSFPDRYLRAGQRRFRT